MSDPISTALLFLINTVFNLYLIVLIIRIVLVWVGANYFDPVTQFIIKLTDFIVKPLRRLIPNVHRIETASIVLVLLIEMIKYFLIAILSLGFPNLLGLLILALGDSIKLLIETFFYAIFLQAILSWVQSDSPINRVLYQFTAPIMRPLHRLIPPVGGFDITPIPALIGLQLLIIILVGPIMALGMGVAFG